MKTVPKPDCFSELKMVTASESNSSSLVISCSGKAINVSSSELSCETVTISESESRSGSTPFSVVLLMSIFSKEVGNFFLNTFITKKRISTNKTKTTAIIAIKVLGVSMKTSNDVVVPVASSFMMPSEFDTTSDLITSTTTSSTISNPSPSSTNNSFPTVSISTFSSDAASISRAISSSVKPTSSLIMSLFAATCP